MSGIRLRARPSGRPNVFVRLAPTTVIRLSRISESNRNSNQTDIIMTSLSSSYVEFLPLAISCWNTDNHFSEAASCARTVVYASYNGGNLLNEDQEWIELPQCIYDTLCADSKSQTLVVTVQIVQSVGHAQQLIVEPLSLENSELLRMDAAWLEDGGLLRQVSLVYPNQVIPLQLSNGTDIVQVRILPDIHWTERNDDLWPDTDINMEYTCIQLLADTEIVVKLKNITSDIAMTSKMLLRTIPSQDDYVGSPSFIELAKILDQPLVSVTAHTVAIHPSTLERLREYALWESKTGRGNDEFFGEVCLTPSMDDGTLTKSESELVHVISSNLIPEECLAMHPLVRLRLHATKLYSMISIRLLSEQETTEARLCHNLTNEFGSPRLGIQEVQIHYYQSKDAKTWRAPYTMDKFCGYQDVIVSNTQTLSEVNKDILEEISSIAEIVPIGSYFCLPKRGIYRLIAVDSVPDIHVASELDRKFIMSCTLSRLLASYFQAENESVCPDALIHHDDDLIFYKASYVVKSLSGPTLDRLLPIETIIPSSIRSWLETSQFVDAVTFVAGERGTGKTHTALTIAAAAELTTKSVTLYLDSRKLRNFRKSRMSTILSELSKIFEEASEYAFCTIILDDLDELIPTFDDDDDDDGVPDDSAQSQQVNPVEMEQSKLIADITRYILIASTAAKKISVIITCRSAELLSEKLLSGTGLISHPLPTPALDTLERSKLFTRALPASVRSTISACLNESSIRNFGLNTRGFRPRDIEQLAFRVGKHFQERSNDENIIKDLLRKELESFVPLASIGIVDESHDGTRWSDVGGMFRAKEALVSAILRPSLYRRIYERTQIRLPRGVLLYGYPGTGKSMCVPALAKECGFPLIVCRGPELLDKYIGASEAKVRMLFAQAASVAPSILFLDELDSLAPRRGSDHTGVTDRVVNQLLTFLDGVEDMTGYGQVYVIAATSRPDKVDPALLRPGRLEKHVFVGFAESEDEWTDLFNKISRNFNLDADTQLFVESGQLIRSVRLQSESYSLLSAADVKAIFCTAHLTAVHDAIAQERTDSTVFITADNLLNAFLRGKPTLSQVDMQHLRSVFAVYNPEIVPSNAESETPKERRIVQKTALR